MFSFAQCFMKRAASYAKKLLAGLSYQAFQADSILRQQALKMEKNGQTAFVLIAALSFSATTTVQTHHTNTTTENVMQQQLQLLSIDASK